MHCPSTPEKIKKNNARCIEIPGLNMTVQKRTFSIKLGLDISIDSTVKVSKTHVVVRLVRIVFRFVLAPIKFNNK